MSFVSKKTRIRDLTPHPHPLWVSHPVKEEREKKRENRFSNYFLLSLTQEFSIQIGWEREREREREREGERKRDWSVHELGLHANMCDRKTPTRYKHMACTVKRFFKLFKVLKINFYYWLWLCKLLILTIEIFFCRSGIWTFYYNTDIKPIRDVYYVYNKDGAKPKKT